MNLIEYQTLAEAKLSTMAYQYYVGGARDEITLGMNQNAWRDLFLYYRVLVDVEHVNASTQILGCHMPSPILIAPCAFHGLADPQGECATALGAQQSRHTYITSTLSNRSLEDISDVSSSPLWFQLYVYRDRDITLGLIRRAECAGYKAIVLTVDAPRIGTRERDQSTQFHLPSHLTLGNLQGTGKEGMQEVKGTSALSDYVQNQLDPSLTWKDLTWLVDHTSLPVLVKGVVRADDAQKAIDHGAQGIIVSNHGGRQLDTAVPTAKALPSISQQVADQAVVLVDGGIRRGTDVIKALALGAHGVLIGRPILWGLSVAGQEGVQHILQILHNELLEAMALCGCPTIASIDNSLLHSSMTKDIYT